MSPICAGWCRAQSIEAQLELSFVVEPGLIAFHSMSEMSVQLQLPACEFPMKWLSHSCSVTPNWNCSSCSVPLALPGLFPWAGETKGHKRASFSDPWHTPRGLQGRGFLTATLGTKLRPPLAGSNAFDSFIQNQTLFGICIFHPFQKFLLCCLEHSCA